MAEFITINSQNPDILYISKQDTYGGVQFHVGLHPDFTNTINWVKQHKARLDREAKAREENESVAAAYEQYQTVLNLVLDIT